MYNFFSFCYEFKLLDLDYIEPIINEETIDNILEEIEKENLEVLLIQLCPRFR